MSVVVKLNRTINDNTLCHICRLYTGIVDLWW